MADLTPLILTYLLETFLFLLRNSAMEKWMEGGDEIIQQYTNYNGARGIIDCFTMVRQEY